MDQQIFNLNWEAFNDHVREMLQELLNCNDHADVTLVCEDKIQFKVHKILLSACSQVFKSIISLDSRSNPLIYLRGIQSSEMKSILEFIYLGQATVIHDKVKDFLDVAKSLEIKELSKAVEFDNEERNDIDEKTQEQIVMSADEGVGLETENKSKLLTPNNYIDVFQVDGKFQCNQCDKQYADKKSLFRHVKTFHDGMTYPCDECNYNGNTKFHLNRHKNSKHKINKITH